MTALHRVIVIIEHGRIVGTQIAGQSERPDAVLPMHHEGAPAVTARLRVGPGQTQHELQVPVPSNLSSPGERERFHASLAAKIADKK